MIAIGLKMPGLETRARAVERVARRRFDGAKIEIDRYERMIDRGTTPSFYDVNIDAHGQKFTVRVSGWGFKPVVRHKLPTDRMMAEILASDIRKAGLFAFQPKVEQIRD